MRNSRERVVQEAAPDPAHVPGPVPLYVSSGREVSLFEAAIDDGIPVMLVGPTGCGKTRLVEHLAARSGRGLTVVVGNDDTTTADLMGRFLVRGGDVEWQDGPVTTAVREGKLCFIDEVAEVRREALAALHPLADRRRQVHLDRIGESVDAQARFGLVCAYNPARAVGFRDLRPAFRQRFATIALDYLPAAAEAEVIVAETGIDGAVAERLVRLAGLIRNGVGDTGIEQPSTRAIVHTARLIARGVEERDAVDACIVEPIVQGGGVQQAEAVRDLVAAP